MTTYNVIDLNTFDTVAVEATTETSALRAVWESRYPGRDAQTSMVENEGRAYYVWEARDNGAITIGIRVK